VNLLPIVCIFMKIEQKKTKTGISKNKTTGHLCRYHPCDDELHKSASRDKIIHTISFARRHGLFRTTPSHVWARPKDGLVCRKCQEAFHVRAAVLSDQVNVEFKFAAINKVKSGGMWKD